MDDAPGLVMVDADGNRVGLVPPGFDGITQIAIVMAVRSVREHRSFYGNILGFPEQSWSRGVAFRLGESLILLDEDASATVDRWRNRGLVSRRFMFGNRKRIGFLQSSVERFVARHAGDVERGAQFTQMTDAERDDIIGRARRLA